MGVLVLSIVILAALVTIASGVWVAVGLMAALRYPDTRNGNGDTESQTSVTSS